MKKIFIDTNIILDVMAQRGPYNIAANAVLKLGIEKEIKLCATSLTFANCVYILKSTYKHSDPVSVVRAYKKYITALPMTDEQCVRALNSNMPDFEDMLQYESALSADCDCILTRNQKHFPKDTLPILTAEEFLTKFTES